MEHRRPAAYAQEMNGDGNEAGTAEDPGEAATVPLDLLLTDAATGMLRRLNPGAAGLRLAAALVGRPGLVAGRGRQLAGELARVAVGRSQVQPSRRDRRFADPAWTGNPLLRRTVQAYLAAAESVEGVVAGAGLDEADAERVGFVLTNLVDALSPSNNPLLNPAAVKAAVDTGGGSVLAGLRHFASDMATSPRVPAMVEPGAHQVGVALAVPPGSVILRTPVFELIQYRPATATVRTVPLLVVPPVINKYYVLDLAPGRSMVEYLVGAVQQVFMISWRNPDARNSEWDLDTYGQAVLDAMDAVQRVTGSEQTALAGTCSGGIIAAMVGAPLAHRGHRRPDRAAGGGHVPGPRLPGRPGPGRGVRLAAPERPDLELLGQQLPARPQDTAVRHLVLERGHHPDDRG